MSQLITVITSVPSEDEAKAIAQQLVQSKLVASAQIFPITSIYSWQGQTCEDSEFQLQLKTVASQYRDVAETIVTMHSYEVPEVYTIATDNAYQPYAQWIVENSKG